MTALPRDRPSPGPVYGDPHRPLFLDDPQPWPNEAMFPFARTGWTLWKTRYGWCAQKRNKLVLPGRIMHALRRRLWESQGGACAYCGVMTIFQYPFGFEDRPIWGIERSRTSRDEWRFATIEHRLPLSRGGTWKRYNLCIACKRCDGAKLDNTDEEFTSLLAAHPLNEPRAINRLTNASKKLSDKRRRDEAKARAAAEALLEATSTSQI